MATATMTSKGQITLPAELRARLRLGAGVKFLVTETKDGAIVLRPKTRDIRELRGFLKYDRPPVSIEDMDKAVRKSVVERYKRSAS